MVLITVFEMDLGLGLTKNFSELSMGMAPELA